MCCIHYARTSPSGLISDRSTVEEAVTSIKRNGVGLKGTLRTKLDELETHSLNVYLRWGGGGVEHL